MSHIWFPFNVIIINVAAATAFAAGADLLLLFLPEQVGAPVDQVEQGKHQRERYPRDDVDAFRPGALSGGELGHPTSAAVGPFRRLHVHLTLS